MIIYLYGPDSYRIQKRIEELKEKFIREIDKSGINIVQLDGEKLEPEKFRSLVYSPGFLVKKRMIIIENLVGKSKNSETEKEILDYLKKEKKGSEDNIIILAEKTGEEPSEKKDKKGVNQLAAVLKKEKYAQEFPSLSGYQLRQWIEKEVKKNGGQIEPSAISLLIDLTGGNLWQISGEISKLTAYRENEKITAKDVDLLVKSKAEESIFNLIDALGNKNRQLALKLLTNQLENGVSWGYLLSMFNRQFRILLQVKDALSGDGRPSGAAGSLASKIGVHPFVVKKAIEQARNYQSEELKNIYRQLLEIDVKLKTTSVSPELLLDLLIAESH